MKKIPLILLLFLLPLCLVPPTAAVYGDESPESITSFAETLSDDVLNFPDSFVNSTIELADYGEISDESSSPDYILTNVKDGSAFNETTATDIEIWFEVDTTVAGFSGFSYAHYMNVDSGTDVDLAAYDFDQDLFVKIDEPVPSSYDWMNGTIYDPDYWNTTHIAFTMYELSGTADLYWDYGEITFHRMTLADSDHYAEGFNDVSDWDTDPYGDEGILTLSTDGDVGSVEADNNGADNDYDGFHYNISTFAVGNILEVRYKINDTNVDFIGIATWSTEDHTGVRTSIALPSFLVWNTVKVVLAVEVKYLTLIVKTDIGDGPIKFDIDYLRISPSNETGWQHDGSTVVSTTALRVNVESDSDHIQFQYSGGGGTGELSFHTDFGGSAIAAIDTDYYPFIGWNVVNLTADVYEVYVDNTLVYTGTGLGLQHVNVKASGEVEYTTITFVLSTVTESMALDWVKGYSIANYTVTQGAVSVSEYLYVDSGVLISSKTTTNLIYVNIDPVPSVASITYAVWNVSASNIETDSFKFTTHLSGGGWVSSSYDQTRGPMQVGTMDDWYLAFSGDVSISAIKFIDTRDWQEIGEVEFVIPVGWDPTFIFGYDAFFIFLGLILIPVSTMYLVRGGREEASADKVFYFLIMFMIGFGLLVGGIMP